MDIVEENFLAHIKAIESTQKELSFVIGDLGLVLAKSLASGGSLFWCGNGGSAADSQHLAAELIGRFKGNRKSLRSMALTTDTSILTCVANDFSYEDIFSRQVEGLGRAGDVLIGISTSGNSVNILRALKAAKELNMTTVALLGKDGGEVKGLADYAIVVPSDSTARIQEVHILMGHIFCEIIEKELGLV